MGVNDLYELPVRHHGGTGRSPPIPPTPASSSAGAEGQKCRGFMADPLRSMPSPLSGMILSHKQPTGLFGSMRNSWWAHARTVPSPRLMSPFMGEARGLQTWRGRRSDVGSKKPLYCGARVRRSERKGWATWFAILSRASPQAVIRQACADLASRKRIDGKHSSRRAVSTSNPRCTRFGSSIIFALAVAPCGTVVASRHLGKCSMVASAIRAQIIARSTSLPGIDSKQHGGHKDAYKSVISM